MGRVDADPPRGRATEPVREGRTRQSGGRWRRLLPEVARFGTSGAVAYLTEVGVFNACLALGVAAAVASLVGAVAGTAVAYAGNRYWTYRGRPFGLDGQRIALFCAVNVVGAAITTGCVVVSHDLLRLDGVLADNLAKNVVGMSLATGFRFWAYRTWVFPVRPEPVGGAGGAGGLSGAGGLAGLGLVRHRAGAEHAAQDMAKDGGRLWRGAFAAAVPPWLAAHALVASALTLAWWWYGGLPNVGPLHPASGLLVWDSSWYRALAVHGYEPLSPSAVRFFPLLPLLVRATSAVTALPATAALLGLCSMCALAYGALLHVLVREEVDDRRTARRAVWLCQLAPGTAVLALGYTEALAGMLAVAFFLFLRRGHWAAAMLAGSLGGLTRPTGLLLALPAAVEFLRARSCRGRVRSRVGTAMAASGPVAGAAAFLGWSAVAGHGWLGPFTVQTRSGLRGGLVGNPFADLLHPRHGLPMAVLVLVVSLLGMAGAVAALWVCSRRLPAAYTAWALAMVAAAVTAAGSRSLPRYLTAVFPLLIAGALVVRGRWRWRLTVGVCCAAFTTLAVLGFGGSYMP